MHREGGEGELPEVCDEGHEESEESGERLLDWVGGDEGEARAECWGGSPVTDGWGQVSDI